MRNEDNGYHAVAARFGHTVLHYLFRGFGEVAFINISEIFNSALVCKADLVEDLKSMLKSRREYVYQTSLAHPTFQITQEKFHPTHPYINAICTSTNRNLRYANAEKDKPWHGTVPV